MCAITPGLRLFLFHVCAWVYLYAPRVYRCLRMPKEDTGYTRTRVIDGCEPPPPLMWMWGTALGFSVRTASTLNTEPELQPLSLVFSDGLLQSLELPAMLRCVSLKHRGRRRALPRSDLGGGGGGDSEVWAE